MPKLTRIKRILVPIDFSKPSLAALRYARTLAKSRRARLEVVHVVEALTYRPMIGTSVDLSGIREAQEQSAGKKLARIAAELERHRVRGTTTLKVGTASTTIVAHAKKTSADLIVMPTQGLGFVKHLLLGSVAEKIVRNAPCPVLTLRTGAKPPPRKLRRILVATDFSPASDLAVEYAAELARGEGALLTVLSAVEPIWAGDVYGFAANAALYNQIESGFKDSLARVMAKLRKKRGLRCKSVMTTGTASIAIVDVAKRIRADLVVVGTRGHGVLDRILLGSVAERVVRTSSRPVLTVRGAVAKG